MLDSSLNRYLQTVSLTDVGLGQIFADEEGARGRRQHFRAKVKEAWTFLPTSLCIIMEASGKR
jgi:hypothetical protein